MTPRLRLVVLACSAITAAVLLPSTVGAEPGFSGAAQIPSIEGATAADAAAYGAVSCPSPTSCTAVGPGILATSASAAARATAAVDSSGTWSRSALPIPGGAKKTELNGVSCSAADACTAVGGVETANGATGLVETETAGVWSASTVTPPTGTEGFFIGLWCASQGNCVAVGDYLDQSFGIASMVAVETSGVWGTATALPAPAGQGVVIPYAIACQDTSDCTAIALSAGSGVTTLSWRETSSTWGAATAIPKMGSLGFVGLSLQCPTSTECLAVGSLENASGTISRPASAVANSGTWSTPSQVPLPKLSPVQTAGSFSSLSCVSTVCEAVGRFTASERATSGVAGSATWNDGTWSSIGLVDSVQLSAGSHAPPGGIGGGPALNAVSCTSTSSCIGVGTFGLGTKGEEGDFAATIATVRPVTVPGAPEIAGGAPGPRRAELFWTPPVNDGGAPVTTFTATLEPGGRSCTTGAYHCTIGGLVDGRQYVVVVRATNSAGKGSAAEGRFIDGGPPSTPRDFHVVGWKHGVLTLAWDASTPPPGMKVTNYDVSIYAGRSLLRSMFTHATSMRIGGLAAHHHYVITLSANDLSAGSPNVTLHVTAP